MALNSKPTGNVVLQLAAEVPLPKMIEVRQVFDSHHIKREEISEILEVEMSRPAFAKKIQPGMTVAITCGSRGVKNINIITKAIVDFVKKQGASPFVFPAMGSHGGATAEGLRAFEQYQMLVYGILLLLVIVAIPGGIYGTAKSFIKHLMHRKEGKADAS